MKRVGAGRWIQHLAKFAQVARAHVDPEGVHQVRVATRRLRVWLRLGRQRKLDAELQWLARALGPARDLDVLLASELGDSSTFARYLGQQRLGADDAVDAALDSARFTRLQQALGEITGPKRRPAKKRLAALERSLRRRARAYAKARKQWPKAGTVRGLDALHRLRRSLRLVRYAREALDLETNALPALQDALGATCDVAALLVRLEAYAQAGGPASAVERTRARLETMLAVVDEARVARRLQRD